MNTVAKVVKIFSGVSNFLYRKNILKLTPRSHPVKKKTGKKP